MVSGDVSLALQISQRLTELGEGRARNSAEELYFIGLLPGPSTSFYRVVAQGHVDLSVITVVNKSRGKKMIRTVAIEPVPHPRVKWTDGWPNVRANLALLKAAQRAATGFMSPDIYSTRQLQTLLDQLQSVESASAAQLQ